MASSINASTTAGVVTTADTSGVLNIQTAGTTAIAISASQAVSVAGTLSATGNITGSSDVLVGPGGTGTNNGRVIIDGSNASSYGSQLIFRRNSTNTSQIGQESGINGGASNDLALYSGSGINTNIYGGGVKTGVFSSTGLAVTGAISSTGGFTSNTTITAQLNGSDSAGAGPGFNLFNTAFDRGWRTQLSASNNKVDYYFNGAAYVAATTIDTSGRLLVGSSIFGNGCTTTTANLPSNAGVNSINNGSTVAFNFGIPTTTTNTNLGNFFNGNGSVGSITVNGSATSYNTSSDYRLKNITGPLTGAKDFIMALKPKQGTWKVDGSAFVGFLAHEFQEVSPSSVSGEKDAVDVDGKPIMQAMQASSSEVMANLVAFIQEQQALITQLQADVAALKGA